jgi:hypothetical protein
MLLLLKVFDLICRVACVSICSEMPTFIFPNTILRPRNTQVDRHLILLALHIIHGTLDKDKTVYIQRTACPQSPQTQPRASISIFVL